MPRFQRLLHFFFLDALNAEIWELTSHGISVDLHGANTFAAVFSNQIVRVRQVGWVLGHTRHNHHARPTIVEHLFQVFFKINKTQSISIGKKRTLIVGKVLFSLVVSTPGMLPADLPSHSYLKRSAFGAGCSIISTHGSDSIFLLLLWLGLSMKAGSAFCNTSTARQKFYLDFQQLNHFFFFVKSLTTDINPVLSPSLIRY